MRLGFTETLWIVIALIGGTVITRFLPFILFPNNEKIPPYMTYLGKALPYAVMGLLVVYCLKGVSIVQVPYGIPEFIGVLSVAILHLWKRNVLLSIGGGTMLYMILVQL